MADNSWMVINSFAPWLSALGTISAVIVALYLSSKDRPKLRVSADTRILLDEGENYPEYLIIEAVNIGIRPIKITNVGWTIGFNRKKSFIQIIKPDINNLHATMLSSQLPITINDGEEARWLVPIDTWTGSFKSFLSWCPRWELLSMKLVVATSHGVTFKATLGDGLKKALLEAKNNAD